MKKIIFVAAFLIASIAAIAVAPLRAAAGQPQEAAWKLLLAIPVGKGTGAVAYESEEGYGQTHGPEAFTVAADGSIYVLDSVNRRILYRPKDQTAVRSIELPGAFYPKDIEWQNDSATVLDGSNRVLRYSTKGKMLSETALPAGMRSEQVYSLAQSGGRVKLWAQNSHEFDLEALPAAVDPSTFPAGSGQALAETGQDKTGKGLGPGISAPDGTRWVAMYGGLTQGIFMTPDGSRKIEIEAYGLFGSARLIGFDRESNLYLLVEDLYDATPDKLGVEVSIRKYAPSGALLGAAKFPDGESLVPSNRPAQVTEAGTVYAMITRKQAVSIYAVTLGSSYHPKAYRVPLDAGVPADRAALDEPSQAAAGATSPYTRYKVYRLASAMTTTPWTWRNSYNWINADLAISRKDTPRDANLQTIPLQLKDLANLSPVAGIPYYWGGFDSLWTQSFWSRGRWTNWNEALNYYRNKIPSQKGPLVGNSNGNVDPVEGGAGLDCSGFVAAPSGLYIGQAKPGTGALASAGVPWRDLSNPGDTVSVALRRLQPMNFLVNTTAGSAHTFYYTRWNADLGGISTLEATTSGTPQGAKSYARTGSEIRNYPYFRSWWEKANGNAPELPLTAKGAGNACYGLAGQVVWYKFTLQPGARTVTLTGISGGDPDLYIYDKAFNPIGKSYQDGVTNEAVNFNVSAAGVYYAMLHVWTTTGCVRWSIAW